MLQFLCIFVHKNINFMCIKMDNQQLNLLNREQLQVFLSGRLGDGCITTSNTNSTYYMKN